MKKLLSALAIMLFSFSCSFAQSTTIVKTKSAPTRAIVTKSPGSPAVVQTPAQAKNTVKVTTKTKMPIAKTETKVTVTNAARPLKNDGTPDKRYKVNAGMKKDGTPDKRYNKNKKP